MTNVLVFFQHVFLYSLYTVAFAVLLTGYLWDFFRFSKKWIVLTFSLYSFFGTVMDQLITIYLGYTLAHQVLYLLMICVIPYCFTFFLVQLPLSKYLYCLSSVSIQVFFIVTILEFFHVTYETFLDLAPSKGLCYIALLAGLNISIVWVFRKFAAPLFRDYHAASAWRKLVILPTCGATALGIFYFFSDFENCSPLLLLIFLACYIALFIADIVAMYSIYIFIRAAAAEASLENANRILALQKEQYKHLSDSIAQTRQARHDLRHHRNAISGFLDADDVEGLRHYLAEYDQTLSNSEDDLYTGNYVADIIVGHYLCLAKQNGIRVDFNLHIPENHYIKDTDLCVLMGNCLENAIDACGKLDIEKRFLRVESAVKNKYLAITISNSYDGNIVLQNSVYLSDKRQHRVAGIGLQSVGAVVKNYNGEMKLEGKHGVFTVYILLKMLEKEKQEATCSTDTKK